MYKRIPFLLMILLVASSMITAQEDMTWVIETIGEGIKPAIAADSNGFAHIAFLNEDIMGGVYYATNASGEWEATLVSEGYFYGPVDITVSADDVPYIAYHDHQADDFDPRKGDEVIAFLDGDSWTLITVSNPGHDGWDNDIAIDADGFWHTAAVDPSQFGSQDGIEYASNAYDSTKKYTVDQIGSGPAPYEFATSIEIREDGVVGITYFSDNQQDLIYAERSSGADGTWTLTTVDTEGDVGRYSSLAYDSTGNAHISYFVNTEGDTGIVRHAWQTGDDEWAFEDVATLEKAPQGHVGSRKLTGIAIDADDNVHLAYGDRLQIHYAWRTEDGWQSSLVAESETDTGNLGALVEFALDSEGTPHITYFVAAGFNPLRGEVMYATLGE